MARSGSRISPLGGDAGETVLPSTESRGRISQPADRRRRLLWFIPFLWLAVLFLLAWVVFVLVYSFLGSSYLSGFAERLGKRDRVIGPALQVAVEPDRVCAFLGGSVSELTAADESGDDLTAVSRRSANTSGEYEITALAAEHLLLLVKTVYADLSHAFSDRYDVGFLNVTAPEAAGGPEEHPFSGSWLFVQKPFWPLLQHWFYAVFSFGVVSPRLYHQDIVLVPGTCPGRQPSQTGYHEVTVADLWDDNMAWQLESGATKECPGMRSSTLFRSSDGTFSNLSRASCAPSPDTGLVNMAFEPWSLSNNSTLMAIIWYSAALAAALAALFLLWAIRSTRRLVKDEQDLLQHMLVGFREYGWCQLSDGSMLVHIPWGYAEEALREILQRLSLLSRSNRDNDSLSAEGRLARDIAVALENPNNGNSVVDDWLASLRSRWPRFGIFALGKENEPYIQRTVEVISHNGKQSGSLAVYRAILGLYHDRQALEPSDPLHALATILKPVAWSSTTTIGDEETGLATPLALSTSERRPLRQNLERISTLESYDKQDDTSASTCWPSGPKRNAPTMVQVGETPPQQFLGIWLLVERLALAVISAVQDAAIRLFASEDEEEEFDDGEAVESDAEEARRSSRRRATGEGPHGKQSTVQRRFKSTRQNTMKDTPSKETRKQIWLSFPGGRWHLPIAGAFHTLIWCILAALWLPPVFATWFVITHRLNNDGEDFPMPMWLLLPSFATCVAALFNYAVHEDVFPSARASRIFALRWMQPALLGCSVFFFAWYGCMVLLWLVLALLLRGADALPAVLMVVGGAAVILRHRARTHDGAFRNLMSIDEEIEDEIDHDGEGDVRVDGDDEESDDDDEGGEDAPCNDDTEGDEEEDDGWGIGANSLSLRNTLQSWKQKRRKGLSASKRWMRWNSARSTLPLSSQVIAYAAIVAFFACLATFVVLGAVAFGVGGAEIFAFVAVIASLAVDFFAQSQHRRLMQRAQKHTKPATSAATQFVHSAVVDVDREPTKEEDSNMLICTFRNLIKTGLKTHQGTFPSGTGRGVYLKVNSPGHKYKYCTYNYNVDENYMRLIPKIYQIVKSKGGGGVSAKELADMEERLRSLLDELEPPPPQQLDLGETDVKLGELLKMVEGLAAKPDPPPLSTADPIPDNAESLEVAKSILAEVREVRSCAVDGFAENVTKSDALLVAVMDIIPRLPDATLWQQGLTELRDKLLGMESGYLTPIKEGVEKHATDILTRIDSGLEQQNTWLTTRFDKLDEAVISNSGVVLPAPLPERRQEEEEEEKPPMGVSYALDQSVEHLIERGRKEVVAKVAEVARKVDDIKQSVDSLATVGPVATASPTAVQLPIDQMVRRILGAMEPLLKNITADARSALQLQKEWLTERLEHLLTAMSGIGIARGHEPAGQDVAEAPRAAPNALLSSAESQERGNREVMEKLKKMADKLDGMAPGADLVEEMKMALVGAMKPLLKNITADARSGLQLQKEWLAERLEQLLTAVSGIGITGSHEPAGQDVAEAPRAAPNALLSSAEAQERGNREVMEKLNEMADKLDGMAPGADLVEEMKMALEASPKLGRVLDIVRTGASEASVVELRESVGAVADDVIAGRAEVVTRVSSFIEERLNSLMSQLGDAMARRSTELNDMLHQKMQQGHTAVIHALTEVTETKSSELLFDVQDSIKQFVSVVQRIVEDNRPADMEFPPDLPEKIVRAVADGISYHSLVSPDLFKNKALWPFSVPHKDSLPTKKDTLAEAFIRILRVYLTPYSFAPISQPTTSRRPTRPQSARGGGSNRPRYTGNVTDREALPPRTGDEPQLPRRNRPVSADPNARRGSDSDDATPINHSRTAWQP